MRQVILKAAGSIVRLCLAFAISWSLLSPSISFAGSLASEIKITKSNSKQFLKVGKFGKDPIYCRIEKNLYRVGVGTKVSSKLTVWRSFDKLISLVKKNKKLKAKAKKSQIASLTKASDKSANLCKSKYGPREIPATPTPTLTPNPEPTPLTTVTASPTPDVSASPSISATPSASETPVVSQSPSPSITASPSESPTISETPSPSASESPSFSPSATESPSPSPSESASPSPTPTESPSPSPSQSASPSPTPTESLTPSPTGTASPSPTPTASLTPTPTPTIVVPAILINCGGPSYVDSTGASWLADSYFTQGSIGGVIAVANPIAGTNDSALYDDARVGDFSYAIPLPSDSYTVTLRFAELSASAAGSRTFNAIVEGQALSTTPIDIAGSAGGTFKSYIKTIDVPITDGTLNISFQKVGPEWPIINAIEIRQRAHQGDSLLQVVMDIPDHLVDLDDSGAEFASLNGHNSKTFESGKQLTAYQWLDGNTVLGNSADISASLGVGSHQITLAIADNSSPARSAWETKTLNVYPSSQVGGVLARYYQLKSGTLDTLIDSLPASPDFIEYRPSISIVASSDNVRIGGSPFYSDVVAAMSATLMNLVDGMYQFSVSGGSLSRIFVDGVLISGATHLTAGNHTLEARLAIASTAALPSIVSYSLDGGAAAPIGPDEAVHDESALAAFINTMPTSGSFQGGEHISIDGLGFNPPGSVIVHWGNAALTAPAITVSATSISLVTPAGSANQQIPVWIEISGQPTRNSNTIQYTYTSTVPIVFNSTVIADTVSQLNTPAGTSGPTAMEWGPDGKLYVGTNAGELVIFSFNDDLSVATAPVITRPLLSTAPSDSILGIAFNPLDKPSDPIKVYISHAPLFGQNGACPLSGPVDYQGQVSTVSGPNFNSATPVITGLSVSNNSHTVSGLKFDNYGDLYMAVGGNTNAGVASCSLGGLPENPLSGAIVKAEISTTGFNGFLNYLRSDNDQTDNNELDGEQVYLSSDNNLSLFGEGVRNSVNLVWSTSGKLYSVSEGPQTGLGQKSESDISPQPNANPQLENPNDYDRLDYVVEGHYYGHANRSRGQFDLRQNKFRWRNDSALLADYTQPLTFFNFQSLTDGLDEYRSTRFNNQLRGGLIVQRYAGQSTSDIYLATQAADGSVSVSTLASATDPGRAILSAPGGALLSADYANNKLRVLIPQDQSAGATLQAFDIFPWRANSIGGSTFVIGGANFGSDVANISVTIGGAAAQITSVSPTRIRGIIPAKLSPTAAMLDVVVTRSDLSQSATISGAFRYLFKPGSGAGVWSASASMPTTLYEVSGGIINGVMYLIGGGRAAPYAYDFVLEKWLSTIGVNDPTPLADRPGIGGRHTAEVFDSKLYVFGGFDVSSANATQIYDPSTNTWTLGPTIPLSTFSPSSAAINDKIILAGGSISQNLTASGTETLMFNPMAPAASAWTELARMPRPVSAASSGTDGQKLYIFGGTSPSDTQSTGFDYVQIYDPATNTWQSSTDVGSTIPPLPKRRKGPGKAVWWGGEFYVMGGETSVAGQPDSAGNMFARVDVYNPVTKTWRQDTPMRTPRHGMTPLLINGRIFVAGGSNRSGPAPVKTMDEFRR